jgi:hypothetical protein
VRPLTTQRNEVLSQQKASVKWNVDQRQLYFPSHCLTEKDTN